MEKVRQASMCPQTWRCFASMIAGALCGLSLFREKRWNYILTVVLVFFVCLFSKCSCKLLAGPTVNDGATLLTLAPTRPSSKPPVSRKNCFKLLLTQWFVWGRLFFLCRWLRGASTFCLLQAALLYCFHLIRISHQSQSAVTVWRLAGGIRCISATHKYNN